MFTSIRTCRIMMINVPVRWRESDSEQAAVVCAGRGLAAEGVCVFLFFKNLSAKNSETLVVCGNGRPPRVAR